MDNAPICVLLVEDNPADVHLVRIVFDELRSAVDLRVVQDGVEALNFLHRRPPYNQAPRPDLILLDLNMPRMRGLEFLQAMRADPSLRVTPVIVLTTSNAKSDILLAYELGANSYITKPTSFDAFLETMAAVDRFWFRVARLPTR
ncbi:MAG: response regulator [Caldilineae bacterium]|nr:MAG: response regulator [Caldilineae bacterium]